MSVLPPGQPPRSPAPARSPRGANVTAKLKFTGGGLTISAPMTVPSGLAPADSVLPSLQLLVDRAVLAGEASERAAGRETTCRQGCAACCRHLVPLSQTETRALAKLVESQPEGRREQLRARFTQAAAQLRAGKLAPDWFDVAGRAQIPDRSLSVGYFALAIDCPFLESESCTIYADRPLACRELKVTSAPAQCSDPEQEGVVPLPLPKLSVAVRGLEDDASVADTTAHWLPLPLALEWAGKLPSARRYLPGPEWVQRFLARLGGRR